MTGQLIITSFKQLRLEMGASGFMTDIPCKTMKALLTQTWLTDLWEFADRFQTQTRDAVRQIRIQRKHDKITMGEFVIAGFESNVLKELNERRMSVHAVTLSDIVSADGWEMTTNAWNGAREEQGGSQCEWPRTQSSLSIEHWEQWRPALEKAFLSRATARSLKEQLLKWMDGVPTHWKWCFCPAEDRPHAKEGLLWRVHRRHLGRTSPHQGKSKRCKTKQLQKEPPKETCLATVLKQGPFIICQGSGARKTAKTPIQKTPTLSFDQERWKRPALDQWAIQEITVPDDGVAMAKAIQNGAAIAVSDGSHKDGRCAPAFVLEMSDQFQTAGRIVGVNSTPGETEVQMSCGSELGGVSGIVENVGMLCARHDITFGAVEARFAKRPLGKDQEIAIEVDEPLGGRAPRQHDSVGRPGQMGPIEFRMRRTRERVLECLHQK
jgi:hypothetical protein